MNNSIVSSLSDADRYVLEIEKEVKGLKCSFKIHSDDAVGYALAHLKPYPSEFKTRSAYNREFAKFERMVARTIKKRDKVIEKVCK
jgi:hypothetical protein